MNYEALGLFYLVSAVLFITGLKLLGSPDTARKGNFISALGMTLAIFITILFESFIKFSFFICVILYGDQDIIFFL